MKRAAPILLKLFLYGDMGVFDTPNLPPLHKNKPFNNADWNNWYWPEEDRGGWKLAPQPWRDFCNAWRTATDCASLMDPCGPYLALKPLGPNDLPAGLPLTLHVRRFYQELFEHVWEVAFRREKGHLIIGQPGIGKTTFLPYLLIRLLQQKQTVLFTLDGVRLYLFYQKEVYFGRIEDFTLTLPYCEKDDIFMWSLFDIKARSEPAGLLVSPQCLPVQTASPDSSRYRIWTRQMSVMAPYIIIMPLWSREELVRGLRYQKRYQDLLDALAEAYPGGSSPPRRSPQDALQCFPGIYELFAQYHFDPTSANLDLPVGSPSENALAWLLNMAIEHFGFVARDVFAAVFDFQAVELLHEDAFKVGFNNLADSVVDLVAGDRRHVNNTRHYIISMHPPDSSDIRNTSYQLRWKSDWVLMKVTKTLHLTKDTEIQQKISDFQGLLQSRDLAGIFIEELARRSEHRIL